MVFKNSLCESATDHREVWRIFIDGAARGNPGQAGVGIALIINNVLVMKKSLYLGIKTNNQAEYLALVFALFLVKERIDTLSIHPIIAFYSDSELLVKQMNGLYKVKNAGLLRIKHVVEMLLKDLTYSFKHVFREENTIADSLANEAIDQRRELPEKLYTFAQENNLLNFSY
jgi:ribonuclease HI